MVGVIIVMLNAVYSKVTISGKTNYEHYDHVDPVRTYTLFEYLPLEEATYSCPCVTTCDSNYAPATFKDCPCDLCIVSANAPMTGNCQL